MTTKRDTQLRSKRSPRLIVLGLLGLITIILASGTSAFAQTGNAYVCSWDVPSNNTSEAKTAGTTPIELYTEANDQCSRDGAMIAAGSDFKVIFDDGNGWAYIETNYVDGSPSLWAWAKTSDFGGGEPPVDCSSWQSPADAEWRSIPFEVKTVSVGSAMHSRRDQGDDACTFERSVAVGDQIEILAEVSGWGYVREVGDIDSGWVKMATYAGGGDDGVGDDGVGDAGGGDDGVGDDGVCPDAVRLSDPDCSFRVADAGSFRAADGVADDGSFLAASGNDALMVDPAGTEARPEIADGLLLDLDEVRDDNGALLTQLTESTRNQGGFRTRCAVSHFSYADPLVHGNEATKDRAHLHMFFGNTSTGKDSVNDQDNQSNADHLSKFDSTCGDLGKHNKSAYWIPALFNGNQEVLMPTQINVYYKTLPEWNNGTGEPAVYAAPEGSNFTTLPANNAAGQAAVAGVSDPLATPLSGMRPIPNDLKMISDGVGKVQIREEEGTDREFLVATVSFKDCIEINSDGSPKRLDNMTYGSFSMMGTRENYEMAKNADLGDDRTGQSCQEKNGTKYSRIPGLEFNIQWEIGTSDGLTRRNWEFSTGKGYDDVVDQASFDALGHVELPELHGDYMASWEGNDRSFDSNWIPADDAMSELVEASQRPHSWVFHNEFSNMSHIDRVGGGDLIDDGGGLMTGTLKVTALGSGANRIPGQIGD